MTGENTDAESGVDKSRSAMVDRGQKFDLLRMGEPNWVADTVRRLWDNPKQFEAGEGFEQPDGVSPEDFNLFRFGVLFGIEYKREYPTDSDEWRD